MGRDQGPGHGVVRNQGSRKPPQSGAAYRRAIAGCNLMFVYDADAAMDNQRPEAVAALLREFMVSKDRFVVSRESGVIHP